MRRQIQSFTRHRRWLFAALTLASSLTMQMGVTQAATPTWPTEPPARICGNLPPGPSVAPTAPNKKTVIVPAGNNAEGEHKVDFRQPDTIYYFETGVHTFSDDPYGQIIPGDRSVFIGAPDAVLDGKGKNLYAFTQGAANVTISHLEIFNFISPKDQGVVNHDSGPGWRIEHNYIHDNRGAGLMIGSDNVIRNNCLKDNGQYGFNAYHSKGVSNVVFERNEVVGNNRANWEEKEKGCGCTGGGKFWETHNARVTNNWVHDNFGPGLWADHNNAEFLFDGNYIENNDGVGLFYEVSYNFVISNNTFKRNAIVHGKRRADKNERFPDGAIYISESGGDARAGTGYSQPEINDNYFENNWDGIVLFESANRFCRPNEPFDTTNGCAFFDRTWGARQKTQNIIIHDNEFRVDKAAIGCTNSMCARMAVMSDKGDRPANTPYAGDVIKYAVTFKQNNRWVNNSYHGPWRFSPFASEYDISFADWQAGPYKQDESSTFDGDMGGPSQGTPPSGGSTPQNFLDVDTSTLEGSAGQWKGWYNATATRSDVEAHTGKGSARVGFRDHYWGVTVADHPGIAATAGLKDVSIWTKLGASTSTSTLIIVWLDSKYATLKTDTLPLNTSTSDWNRTKATVEAPEGTRTVLVNIRGSGSVGDSVYFDDIVIGGVENALDYDTASMEGSLGEWKPWYSTTLSRSYEEAYSGTFSLVVNIAGRDWGVVADKWPGFKTTPGVKRISYRAKGKVAAGAGTALRVKWFDKAQQLIQTEVVALNPLSPQWQLATSDVSAPPGTSAVRVELYGSSGTAGDTIYLDDVVITPVE